MDFFLVGLAVNRNLAMFASPLGTWIPFALIFLSTWLTGLLVGPPVHTPARRRRSRFTDTAPLGQ